MGNVLDPRIGSSGPGSNPGQVTVLIVLLGKTLTLTVLSPPRSINGLQQIVKAT